MNASIGIAAAWRALRRRAAISIAPDAPRFRRQWTGRSSCLLVMAVMQAACAGCSGQGEPVPTIPPGPGGEHSPPRQTLEAINLRRVPLGESVFGMSESAFTTDGQALVVSYIDRAAAGAQAPGELGLVDPETGALRCLTCGLPIPDIAEAERPNLGKPQPVSDGKRVMFRTGERPDSDSENPLALFSGDAGFFRYYFLECEPSVVQCDSARILPIRLPAEGTGALTQNREARISPDPNWFAWTEVKDDGTRMTLGRLRREGEEYRLEDLWVINPAFDLRRGSSDDWRAAMPLYEFKNFAEGGRIAYYASFQDAQNYDVWRVDLASGERRQVTTDIEWNEGTVTSPDGASFVNGSSRGRGRMAPFAQLPRPPFVDFGVYILTGRYSLGGKNRRCLLEPWLLDADGQSGEYFGQPINPENEPGWGSHGPGSWSPDGTRYTFWERNYEDGADPESRIAVAHFPARRPSPARQAPFTPRPEWATPRAQWQGALNKIGVFRIAGKHSGSALLTLTGLNANTTVAAVQYLNYSDDGETVLNGSETALNPFALVNGSWLADLRVSGRYRGSMQARVFSLQKQLYGQVRSDYRGVAASGLPDAECQPESLPAPQLQIAYEPGGADELRLRITARPVSDDSDRPVRGVQVSTGSASALSDDSGRVRLPLPAGKAAVEIRAEAGGFRPLALSLGPIP